MYLLIAEFGMVVQVTDDGYDVFEVRKYSGADEIVDSAVEILKQLGCSVAELTFGAEQGQMVVTPLQAQDYFVAEGYVEIDEDGDILGDQAIFDELEDEPDDGEPPID